MYNLHKMNNDVMTCIAGYSLTNAQLFYPPIYEVNGAQRIPQVQRKMRKNSRDLNKRFKVFSLTC